MGELLDEDPPWMEVHDEQDAEHAGTTEGSARKEAASEAAASDANCSSQGPSSEQVDDGFGGWRKGYENGPFRSHTWQRVMEGEPRPETRPP